MLITILVFGILLSFLVLIHELGHFLTAKKFGIRVDEFGFGLPPRLWGKKIGETIYSLNALPIGGFVKLYGEDGGEEAQSISRDVGRAFYLRPKWQRMVVLASGVTTNFVLAAVIISYLFTQGVPAPYPRVHIDSVEENSPAKSAGLLAGDVVESLNGQAITSSQQFSETVQQYLGQEVTLAIIRGANFNHLDEAADTCQHCQQLTIQLTPRKNPPLKKAEPEKNGATSRALGKIRELLRIQLPQKEDKHEGPIGVGISNFETNIYPWYKAPFVGIRKSLVFSWEILKAITMVLVKFITLQPVSDMVAGPVRIAQETGEAVKYGPNAVLNFLGVLSLNLAIVNALPFPALDGGRLLFILLETVTGKRVRTHYEQMFHQVGMIILLILFIMVTINDFARILYQGR